jgi:hypothetical protein
LKQLCSILLLLYYFFGNFYLPQGDFAVIVNLPNMYEHCKATEDKDMTPFDFITDHLINIDGVFDHHDHNDEQKPHIPIRTHHSFNHLTFLTQQFRVSLIWPQQPKNDFSIYKDNFYYSDFNRFVFRPPVV